MSKDRKAIHKLREDMKLIDEAAVDLYMNADLDERQTEHCTHNLESY